MTNEKDRVIKILIQNGYRYELEDSTIYVYVEEYNQEKINEIKRLIEPYNGSIGFRPLKQKGDQNEE